MSSQSVVIFGHLTTLKIDRSLISGLSEDNENGDLVKAIMLMAKSLGLKVVAEGIETAEQAKILRGCQCDYGQGYHLSKPLPASKFEHFLAHYKKV